MKKLVSALFIMMVIATLPGCNTIVDVPDPYETDVPNNPVDPNNPTNPNDPNNPVDPNSPNNPVDPNNPNNPNDPNSPNNPNDPTDPNNPANPTDPNDVCTVLQSGWVTPKASNYEYSMTFVTQLSFNGVINTNTGTELAAFCGDECRGKVNLFFDAVLNAHICYLTIYSNTQSGETIKLKAFNLDKKNIYSKCSEFVFQSNAGLGAPSHILACAL
jgi:hypothetical protein